MKTRKAIIFMIVLAVLTGIAAFMHLNTREEVAEGTVQVSYKDQTYVLDMNALDYEQISGVRVNGNGEEIPVEGLGILLREVVDKYKIADYSKVTVVSDDAYHAEVTAEEVTADGKVYFMYEEKELRLIVFGDTNSKRSVSNVVQVVIE